MGSEENMKTCTFFGNRDCKDEIKHELLSVIEDCIVSQDVGRFYVGNNGNFDKIAISLLRQLKNKYPHIVYEIVLAYHPSSREADGYGEGESIFPDGIERAPRRYAITYRNNWMLKRSECVICYIRNKYGSSYQYATKAERSGKEMFYIGDGDMPLR